MNVVFFLLGDSPASEFCVPTFRNNLFHLNRLCRQEIYVSRYILVKIHIYELLSFVAYMEVIQDMFHVATLGVLF